MSRAALAAAAFALALLLPAQEAPPLRQADVTRETTARAALEVAQGKEIKLQYRTISWSAEAAKRMRNDPAVREQFNQRFALAFQSELSTPFALSIGGRRLEPDAYRVGLAMDDAGAWQFTMLLDHDTVRFPIDLSESPRSPNFPYLTMSLLPAEDGLFALVLQWGKEYGRVVFTLAL